MKRPDQDRFDAFSKHFQVLDDELSAYCAANNFKLEKNLLRQPGRVLRREGNPHFLVDFSLSGYWLEMEFREDMPHTITAIGYYEPPESEYIWKISREIVTRELFSRIVANLRIHLDQACHFIGQWTPEVMLKGGERTENLANKFGV